MTLYPARMALERLEAWQRPVSSLAACIVNHQGERYLPWTLAAVATRARADRVVVVDSGSTDRSLEIVGRHCPSARVLRLSRNRGPAAARNAALAAVEADRILFLDNDVLLDTRTVEELQAALDADPAAGIAMPRVVHAERADTIQYDGAEAHWLGSMVLSNAERPVREADDRVREIGSLVTACFLVDMRRLPPGLTFDESFFFSFEDHDFGLRFRARGGRILSVPRAVCLHRGGTAGLSWRPDSAYPRRRVYGLVRNRWLVILKTYRARTLALLAPGLLVYEAFQLAGLARRGWLGAWVRAVAWIFRHRSRVLGARRTVQRTRSVGDGALLSGGPVPLTPGFCRSAGERAAVRLLDLWVCRYWRAVRRLL
jgi:GT2 family glycosyltransferase